MTFTISVGKRLLFLFLALVLGFGLVSILAAVMQSAFGIDSTPAMRILAVVQDLLIFILPAVITALLACRQPAQLLCLDVKPRPLPLVMAICTLICSIPAMDAIIWLNQQLPMPESFAAMEQSAEQMVRALQGEHTVGNLLMSILIVGVFAGLSEEIFFRGSLQRLLATGGLRPHAAIWLAAVIFSCMHFQAYGFVPRMLLGAFFGYTLYWTRSLWVPVILHVINNTVYLVTQWLAVPGEADMASDYSNLAVLLMIVASVVLTAFGLHLTRKATRV